MPVLEPLAGMRLATAATGTDYGERSNLLLAAFDPGTAIAGVLTTSSTAAAPVRWCRQRFAAGARPRALVVSAGNANCFTGAQGEAAVARTAALAAELVGCEAGEVYVASTGRIGQQLDMAAFETALRSAGERLEVNSWTEAATAIMTTDRFPKTAVRRFEIGADEVVLQGMTKGNTMMAPNMATTLGFLFTDAAVSEAVLGPMLRRAVERTYNRITVDNTQSTNDTLLLFATGAAAGRSEIAVAAAIEPAPFAAALEDLLAELAGRIIEDAAASDGLVVEITVGGAESEAAAARMARRVADSYLVRRDLAGGEMMPGRIIAAVGMAEERVAQSGLTLSIGDEVVGREGAIVGAATIDPGPLIQDRRLRITVDVAIGEASATVHTVVPRA